MKNKKTQSLFSSCKAHIVFTPFLVPQTGLPFLLSCLLGLILGRWRPLKLCCLGKHQHRVKSHPGCTGWWAWAGGSSWGCLGTSERNHSAGWHSWTSSGMHEHGWAVSWELEKALAACSLCWWWTLQQGVLLLINSSFVLKTSVVQTRSAPNHKGRICHSALMRCWQRVELVLGILHISFLPLGTTEAREEKKQSKTTYCLYFLIVSKRGGIMQTPINPMALLGENPVAFGRGCWQITGSVESIVLFELFITTESAGVGSRLNGRQLEF